MAKIYLRKIKGEEINPATGEACAIVIVLIFAVNTAPLCVDSFKLGESYE